MKNYIKHIATIAFTVLLTNSAKAQSEISLFHLGDYVQQSSEVSPVYLPKNSFSLGFPGISGVAVGVGTGFKASDLLVEVPGSENLKFDFTNLYNQIDGDYNHIQVKESINLLNLAFKRKKGSISFFINQKANINWQMSKNGIINILGNGITKETLINDNIDVMTYAEAGIGFTQQFLKDKLAIGFRVKYLVGIANGSTEDDGFAKINVNDDLTWTLNTQNATARYAGIPLGDNDDEEFSTGNTGIGFDIGASYEILPNFTVEVAVNDIGSITWKDNVYQYSLSDVTNLVVDGADLDTDEDILDELLDKLEEDVETKEQKGESYKTSLATNSFISASYKLANRHMFRATMFKDHNIEDSEAVLALGYNLALNKTTYGIVGIKDAQGDMNLGLNLATKLGPLQIYAATDNLNALISSKSEDINKVTARVGINFVFGYNKWLNKNSSTEETTEEEETLEEKEPVTE